MSNILILGNGSREKAIAEFLAPNNVEFNTSSLNMVLEQIKKSSKPHINMVIPSSEEFLCGGIVDILQEYANENAKSLLVFGPNKQQSQIEGSKHFAKQLMDKLGIPTAPWRFYPEISCFDVDYESDNKKVIKYSGLAKGKGVYLPETIDEFRENQIQLYETYKEKWEGLIVEDRLEGVEVSVLAFCNGKECFLMPQAQDYKKVYDGDIGPNTGGMGAVAPVNIITDDELKEIKSHMDNVVKELGYKGVLYAGLMKTKSGIYFLEFNCRFGDPETQVILNLLDGEASPLFNILTSCIKGETPHIVWKNGTYAANVVMSHVLYPHKKLDNPVIIEQTSGFTKNASVKLYPANVFDIENDNRGSYTTGGRVFSLVSTAKTMSQALQNVYNNIHKVDFDGAYYRRDIGSNAQKLNDETPHDSNGLDKPKVAILASGNGTSAQYLLEKTGLVKVILTNKKNAGILEKAQRYDLPFFYVKDDYDKIINILTLYEIDVVLLLGYNRIVPASLFSKFYTINIHPSLLPNYKGMMDMNIHRAIVERGDFFTGCTLHEVTDDVDGGWILQQKQMKVDTNVPELLKSKVQELEKECIYDFLVNYEKRIKYDVDVEEGNAFVELLKRENPNIGGFCAEYEIPLPTPRNNGASVKNSVILGAAADGVGTKLDLAIQYNTLDKIGIDLVAMNVNDLIAGGCRPLFFMDYIALDKMDKVKCRAIIKGILKGCQLAGCKLIGGETAEMKGIYLNNKLDLAGFSIGQKIMNLPLLSQIKPGYCIYGIESSGIHSNGYTLVRKLWKNCVERNAPTPPIESILEPTRIYSEVLDYCNTHRQAILGIAHITGGGYHENLIRILPKNLYFQLDEWEFPPIFKWIQRESGFSRNEMLDTFNCGYGMVIVTKPDSELPNSLLPLPFGKKIGRVISR